MIDERPRRPESAWPVCCSRTQCRRTVDREMHRLWLQHPDPACLNMRSRDDPHDLSYCMMCLYLGRHAFVGECATLFSAQTGRFRLLNNGIQGRPVMTSNLNGVS